MLFVVLAATVGGSISSPHRSSSGCWTCDRRSGDRCQQFYGPQAQGESSTRRTPRRWSTFEHALVQAFEHGLVQAAGMAALVRKASFGRKPHIRMSGAKVRALPTLAQPTCSSSHQAPGAVRFHHLERGRGAGQRGSLGSARASLAAGAQGGEQSTHHGGRGARPLVGCSLTHGTPAP